MKAARGNNPRLWEPGARVVYQDGEKRRHTGVVETSSEQYVVLKGGLMVRKADLTGPDRRKHEGESFWMVTSHHESGTRLTTVVVATSAERARAETQKRLDKLFAGGWTAKGARKGKWQ